MEKIPSRLVYYRTDQLSTNPVLLKIRKFWNQRCSRKTYKSIPKKYPHDKVSKKALSAYIGKTTTSISIETQDIPSFRDLGSRNIKAVQILPQNMSYIRFGHNAFLLDPQIFSSVLFHWKGLRSLEIQDVVEENVLKTIGTLAHLTILTVTIHRISLFKKLDLPEQLESLNLTIRHHHIQFSEFEEDNISTASMNLIKFSTLPKLKTLSLVSIKFKTADLKRILSYMTNLQSFKINAMLIDRSDFNGERINAFLSQIDYLKIGQIDYLDPREIQEDPRFLNNSKKALILKLEASILANLQPLLNNCLNLQTLSFEGKELVESMKIDPNFTCPDHIRNIIFRAENGNSFGFGNLFGGGFRNQPQVISNQVEGLSCLAQFMSSIKSLENFSFESSFNEPMKFNKFLELHKLEFFKSLKELKVYLDIKALKSCSMLLEQYAKQLSQLQNLKSLRFGFSSFDVPPLEKLAKYFRALSGLESLDISLDRGMSCTTFILKELAFPFADFSQLSHFRLNLPDLYSPESIKLGLEEVTKWKNIQVFEMPGQNCFQKMDFNDLRKIFQRLQGLKTLQLLRLGKDVYEKPN